MKLVYISFFLFGLLTSCQPKENQNKFEWNAGFSAPKNYIAGGPYVEFFYKGKSIAGNSSNVGINPGWGRTSGGISGGEIFKPIPDSVFVKWRCGFDLIEYEGGIKLSRKKMLELFKKKAVDVYGEKVGYSVIIVGMAPGGNTTIWMQAGSVITEIQKFKAQKKEKIDPYDPTTITLWTSKGQEAKDILKYISLHGVPYSVWEKGDKEYNYDIGFSGTKKLNSLFDIAITGFAKDGSYVYSDSEDLTKFNERHKINLKKLPVQFSIRWISIDKKDWYEGTVILPQNLPNELINFEKKYGINPKIIVSIEEESKYDDNVYGDIFLQNYMKKIKIMSFRLAKFNFDTKTFNVSKYTLPKDFVFPKWEGREPLKFPELDYWQEK